MSKSQTELLQELAGMIEAGMQTKEIAEACGITERAVRYRKARLAQQGYSPEHGYTHTQPEPYLVTGVSTLFNGKGELVGQWVKSALDKERVNELLDIALEAFKSEVPRVEVVPAPSAAVLDPALLNQYTITDFHLGMLAWGEETGADWDMQLAESLLVAWFKRAIEMSPPAATAVLAQMGDFLHWDGLDAVTPTSGHVLDADTRFQKLTRVAIRVTRVVIDMLLQRHEHVHVVFAEGNHDMASSIWFREWLAAMYENEPRISIDRSPDPYYCYEFGAVSLFYHHGHKRKVENLQTVLAAKFREVLGRTKFSYAHVGHLHHYKALETPLMVLEQHRTLAAKDAYASRGGWLSGRSADVITYHREYGQVGRVTITPDMVK